MTDTSSHSNLKVGEVLPPEQPQRIQFGFFCDINGPRPCPHTLLSYCGHIHKLEGNLFFCELKAGILCPLLQAEVDLQGASVQ